MAQKASFRLRFVFWLDVEKPEERELAEYVEELKVKRSFSRALRDGLRLIRDLRAGEVGVLCELFPWVGERLRSQPDNSELLALLSAMMHNQAAPLADRPPVTPIAVSPLAGVKPVVNEHEAKARTVAATLASLEDF